MLITGCVVAIAGNNIGSSPAITVSYTVEEMKYRALLSDAVYPFGAGTCWLYQFYNVPGNLS
jgi:hypothetical protein